MEYFDIAKQIVESHKRGEVVLKDWLYELIDQTLIHPADSTCESIQWQRNQAIGLIKLRLEEDFKYYMCGACDEGFVILTPEQHSLYAKQQLTRDLNKSFRAHGRVANSTERSKLSDVENKNLTDQVVAARNLERLAMKKVREI